MRRCTLSLFVLLIALPALAETPKAVGRVLALRGVVEVQSPGGETRSAAGRGTLLFPGQTLITAEASAVQIRMEDGTLVGLGSSTRLTLASYEVEVPRQRRGRLQLGVGRIWARVTSFFGSDSEFEVHTDNAVAGVRGTSFIVELGPAGTKVSVVDGSVAMADAAAKLEQVLGPMLAGLFSGSGEIVVSEVTPAELAAAAADVDPGLQLSERELETLRRIAGASTEADAFPELNPLDVPPAFGLPLEPGVGNGAVRGRVEVTDD
jgi:hypothetical protein